MRWPWSRPRTDATGRPVDEQPEDSELAPPAAEPGNAPQAPMEDVDVPVDPGEDGRSGGLAGGPP
jgi:hypothetical protein